MDDEFFIFMTALVAASIALITLFAFAVSESSVETRDVQVCEITTTDTGSIERCWDEKEVVN